MSTATHDAPASVAAHVKLASHAIGGAQSPQPMALLTHVAISPDWHCV
jgi:hypothetical protein